MWCFFNKTIAYIESNQGGSSSTNLKIENTVVTFWDTQSNQFYSKNIDTPLGMVAAGEHCAFAIEAQKFVTKDSNVVVENFKDQMYQILICNSLGTTVDSKYTDLHPQFITMNSTHVIVASKDQFLLWQYHTPKGASSLHGVKIRKDKRYHIDDSPSGAAEVLTDLGEKAGFEGPVKNNPTKDPICFITASDKILLIARESGVIQEYVLLPNVAICNRHLFANRTYKMAINCNSTRACVIDSTGLLNTIDLNEFSNKANEGQINSGRIERKDVWSVCWAKDNPQLVAIMEKTRMYIFRGSDPEEPISCSGYICLFEVSFP